ncbi:hypothetical protein CYMTET_32865 [Cymbomonas tetramitiformis]|uniref:Uncharacterized protein n=1 Tax=Cymbomonas tetramitiformis TaxID=36881 RepID=A0AAE0FEH2_9CHLO|nr:hypothetical protein CYMTET_32865 [Cymbomonas tetramitiformis]
MSAGARCCEPHGGFSRSLRVKAPCRLSHAAAEWAVCAEPLGGTLGSGSARGAWGLEARWQRALSPGARGEAAARARGLSERRRAARSPGARGAARAPGGSAAARESPGELRAAARAASPGARGRGGGGSGPGGSRRGGARAGPGGSRRGGAREPGLERGRARARGSSERRARGPEGLSGAARARGSSDDARGKRSSAVEIDRARVSILDECAIVASTLAFSGAGMFARMTRAFDVVVIDEAAQAIEPSTMVPLCHGCRQVFLVGDPLQLPATVLSRRAKDLGYDNSMFKRFQDAKYPVHVLTVQYRMHPQIRSFPSDMFYEGSLEDGPSILTDTTRKWHEHRVFGPFTWINIRGFETNPEGSHSKINRDEADAILLIIKCLHEMYPELREPGKMAVISPYKEQVKLVQEMVNEELDEADALGIDINTIDGFQGREKEVAIFSCVRADPKKGIGFVGDQRRMNVGLTRGRASMIVVGHSTALKSNWYWYSLVRQAKTSKAMFTLKKPYDQSLARLTSGQPVEDEIYSEDEEWPEEEEEEEVGEWDDVEWADADFDTSWTAPEEVDKEEKEAEQDEGAEAKADGGGTLGKRGRSEDDNGTEFVGEQKYSLSEWREAKEAKLSDE